MLSNRRNLSILLKDTNSSNAKGIALPSLRDKVIRRRFMKESTTKAVEGESTWPVTRRIATAMKVAMMLEVNSELSTNDNRALF